jgi:hypothetical protein
MLLMGMGGGGEGHESSMFVVGSTFKSLHNFLSRKSRHTEKDHE